MTIFTSNTIGCVRSYKLIQVLLDSGSTGCLIKISYLPKGVVPKTLANTNSFKALVGKLNASDMVSPRDICIPEFDKYRSIAQQHDLISDNDNCRYDMIVGTNFCPILALNWNTNM